MVEIDNQSFYFLLKHKTCLNDDNSRYEPVSNRMQLLNKNGRQMENGVMIGKLMISLRKIALQTPGRDEFPVLDPVVGNLTDSSK